MAGKKQQKPVNKRLRVIDPVYKKFTAKAFQSMTSTEFYEFFQKMMSNGQHDFQFSNRRLEKKVDETWVNIIEATLPAFDEICRNPRIIITQEELITNVVQARKVDSQVVRYICSHGNLVESVDENGDVVPSKVLNFFKEESWDTYENRFVYTLLDMTFRFVELRYRKLFVEMQDEYGANLKMNVNAQSEMEQLSMNMHLRIQQIDDYTDSAEKNDNIFARIIHIYQTLGALMDCRFSHEMSKFSRVKPPLVPTNAIKKNPLLKKCVKLWDFIWSYKDVGYSVELIEQNPEINEKFERDIWSNIMFTYIILKGYLEDTRSRAINYGMKGKKTTFKPRYIKEIIEEMIRDYDLPDIEVRKVLIEELTKEQLLREQEEERRRILAEHEREKREKKRRQELEKQRLEKEKERQRLQKQKEREKLRLQKQKEKERELARIKREKERIEASDARKGELFTLEITHQLEGIESLLQKREAERLKKLELEEKRQRAAEKLKMRKQRKKKVKVEEVKELLKEEIQNDIESIVDDSFEKAMAELAASDSLTKEQKEKAMILDELSNEEVDDDFTEEMQVTLANLIKKQLESEIEAHVEEVAETVSQEALADFEDDQKLTGKADMDSSLDEVIDEASDQYMDQLQKQIHETIKEEVVKNLNDEEEEKKPEKLREILRKWLLRK